jgi:hypothetical protein
MWGSDESVEQIRGLPTKLESLDVVFPSRTSLVLIGAEPLRNSDFSVIAARVAQDVSVFEQKACASPHTVFLETEDEAVVESFAEALREAMSEALRTLPKAVPSREETAAILNLRAQYDMRHRAWCSSGTEFTILADNLFQLGPAIGNRTVYLRKIVPLERVAELVTPKVQSIGIVAKGEEFERLTAVLGAAGVQRFSRLGTMTHFESPWDGFFIPQSLVRWASRPAT